MLKSGLAGALMASAVGLLSIAAAPALAADAPSLRAGAAKTDITPTQLAGLYPIGAAVQFEGVHDPIFARALVLDNGKSSVAIVATDLIELEDTLPLRQRIQRELGIAADHIMITASHDHSAPKLGDFTPQTAAYAKIADEKIFDTVKRAKAALQPARMGSGAGVADVNVNRDEYRPVAGPAGKQGWDLGFNPNGPSDKAVRVLKFETAGGAPIAILFNYGVHSVATMQSQMISGDLAGAAEHVVERRYDDKAVALFAIGAAGDQNPRFSGTALNGPNVPRAGKELEDIRTRSWPAMEAQGYMLGSEVLRVAGAIQASDAAPRLAGGETTVTCPVKAEAKWSKLGPTVPIRLGVILIGDIALGGVAGEVVTNIESHLKRLSPLTDTLLVTLADGRTGYYVDDAAYDQPLFEVGASPAARGCAENGIAGGLAELIRKLM